MDSIVLVGIIINAALLIVTGGAAVATIVQARVAVAARQDAETARDEAQRVASEATDAFKRQAAALEKSNELKEAETRLPAWSGPKWVSGERYSMTNTTGRRVKVARFDVQPDDAARFLHIDGNDDRTYDYGDSFDYIALKASGIRPKKLTIFWHYADEPADDLSQFIVPL